MAEMRGPQEGVSHGSEMRSPDRLAGRYLLTLSLALVALIWAAALWDGWKAFAGASLVAALAMTLVVFGAAAWIARAGRRQMRAGDRLVEAEHLAGLISLEWLSEGDLVTWSRSPEFLLGPRPAGGYPVFREMTHPDDRQTWLEVRQGELASMQGCLYPDFRIVRTDGELRWISCSQRTFRDAVSGVKRTMVTMLDITGRKASEFALAQSELKLRELAASLEAQVSERTSEALARTEQLRVVMDNVPLNICFYDAEGVLRFANQRYVASVGATDLDAILNRSVQEILPPERRQLHQGHFDAALAGETRRYQVATRLDPSRWNEFLMIPQHDASGRVKGVFSVAIDCTDRKRAEDDLKTAISQIEATVEATADGIVVVGLDRRITRVNQRYLDMWDIPRDLVDRGDYWAMFARVRAQVSDPEGFTVISERVYADPRAELSDKIGFKDGRTFERYSRPQVVDGRPVGRVWSIRDVTEKLRAESALRVVDERYRMVVSNMVEGVIVRNQTGEIIDCNPSAERITGRRREEMLGTMSVAAPDWEVVNEAGVPIPWDQRSALTALRTGHLQSAVVMGYRKPDGTVLWLSSTSQPLYREGAQEPSGVFTTFVNVTTQKLAEHARDALEAQLRESQKMEAMGTLAGGIAHDFNNILAAILGNVALARDDIGNDHPAAVSLDEIGKAGERAKLLVQQILAFSRKQPRNFLDQPLQPIVEDTIRLLRATLPAGIEIETRFEGPQTNVNADGTQIGQVLMNLCTNAWHAMAKPGAQRVAGANARMSVRLDTLRLDASSAPRFGLAPGGVFARLTVTDTGEGMDAATLARIFEPFYTTKPVGQGTGLGLAVVHGIVKAHGGAIAVTTAPGQGSTFEVLLPSSGVAVASHASSTNAMSAVSGQGKHVMYIDDEAPMVFLVKRMLQKRGYTVSGYERPEEALAALRAAPEGYDVVVSDFNMPQLSGLDVAREVRDLNPALPMVVTSGYLTEELRARSGALGVRHLIYKPNTVEELCEAIAQVLASPVS